jgi:hypothetical protein
MSYSDAMPALAVPLHMGALHPLESLVMAALALGPFVILAVVVTVVSRRDRRTQVQRKDEPGQAARVDRSDAGRRDVTSTRTETAASQSVQQ